MKKVIEKDAQYRGLSESEVKKAVEQYEEMKAQQKKDLKKEREEAGYVKGEKRDEAINIFRATYGKLEGASLANLDGWRAESIYRETCNQTEVTYYNSQNRPFKTVMDAEAFLGVLMMQGKDIPSIELARSRVTKDESGKVVNTARHEGVVTKTVEDSAENQRKRRKIFVTSSMYGEAAFVTVPLTANKNDKSTHGLSKKQMADLRKSAKSMLSLLRARHFPEDTDLFALHFRKEPASTSHAVQLQGLYYKGSERINDRAYYQQVRTTHSAGQLCCTNLYIFWSLLRKHWKVSASLDDSKAGLAIAEGKEGQDYPSPDLSWQILSLLLRSNESQDV